MDKSKFIMFTKIFIFYVLFSWIVVYKAFENEDDSLSEKSTLALFALLSGWFMFPMLLGNHLRDNNKMF